MRDFVRIDSDRNMPTAQDGIDTDELFRSFKAGKLAFLVGAGHLHQEKKAKRR